MALDLLTFPVLNVIAPNGLDFTVTLKAGVATTDYSGYSGYWNIGDPDDRSLFLFEGTETSGCVGGVGVCTLTVTRDIIQTFPVRPLPYYAWMADGNDTVPVARGKFVVQQVPGIGTNPLIVNGEIIDGGLEV